MSAGCNPVDSWDEDIILVTGYARSGTTLMQGLLCLSPDVMEPAQESPLLRGLLDAYEMGLWSWDTYGTDLFADRDEYVGLNRRLLGLYFAHLRARFAAGKRLLHKAPNIGPRIPSLATLAPRARFVVMLRDLRAVIASQAERLRRIQVQPDLAKEINDFVRLYRDAAKWGAEHPDRLMIVRYEDLVQDVDAVMPAVASFLGIVLPDNLASRSWPVKRSGREASASELDGRPVSTASLTRYRSVMTPEVLAVLESRRVEIESKVGMPVFFDDPSTASRATPAIREAMR